MIKNVSNFLILLFIILFSSCTKEAADTSPSLIIGEWIMSCEETSDDYRTYRHIGFTGNKSCRGLYHFIFNEGGLYEFNSFECILPGTTNDGIWTVKNQLLTLTQEDGSLVKYQVNSLETDKLIMKQMY